MCNDGRTTPPALDCLVEKGVINEFVDLTAQLRVFLQAEKIPASTSVQLCRDECTLISSNAANIP